MFFGIKCSFMIFWTSYFTKLKCHIYLILWLNVEWVSSSFNFIPYKVNLEVLRILESVSFWWFSHYRYYACLLKLHPKRSLFLKFTFRSKTLHFPYWWLISSLLLSLQVGNGIFNWIRNALLFSFFYLDYFSLLTLYQVWNILFQSTLIYQISCLWWFLN